MKMSFLFWIYLAIVIQV